MKLIREIEKFEKLVVVLKKYSSFEEYKELYEKEKDRFVKLHSYYTQIEADRQNLKIKVDGWE
jgi:hypothetical protein